MHDGVFHAAGHFDVYTLAHYRGEGGYLTASGMPGDVKSGYGAKTTQKVSNAFPVPDPKLGAGEASFMVYHNESTNTLRIGLKADSEAVVQSYGEQLPEALKSFVSPKNGGTRPGDALDMDKSRRHGSQFYGYEIGLPEGEAGKQLAERIAQGIVDGSGGAIQRASQTQGAHSPGVSPGLKIQTALKLEDIDKTALHSLIEGTVPEMFDVRSQHPYANDRDAAVVAFSESKKISGMKAEDLVQFSLGLAGTGHGQTLDVRHSPPQPLQSAAQLARQQAEAILTNTAHSFVVPEGMEPVNTGRSWSFGDPSQKAPNQAGVGGRLGS